MVTPYNIALNSDNYTTGDLVIDQSINVFFMIDIIFNFCTAIQDVDMELITNHRVSAIFNSLYRESPRCI